MKRYALKGVDAINNNARVSEDVIAFIGHNNYFKVVDHKRNFVMLITPKGSYRLDKHPTQEIYTGEAKGHKVHVSLKKIVGEIRFW